MKQKDFLVENLGDNNYLSPLQLSDEFYTTSHRRVLYNNTISNGANIKDQKLFSFEGAAPH